MSDTFSRFVFFNITLLSAEISIILARAFQAINARQHGIEQKQVQLRIEYFALFSHSRFNCKSCKITDFHSNSFDRKVVK